ncbi:MAG TPA: bifunctional metallophosphatase/5'-nucleotidase [Fibrobacteria bacterium]|nr:bifunctional metallophosphatase/5'-nucleotidase [Fibrobacteria bacterium]
MRQRLLSILLILAATARPWDLAIAHINDIHSHLDPTELRLSLDTPVAVRSGGAARLVQAIRVLREEHPDLLVLHAGDELVGTPWFTQYDGLADAAFLDRVGIDAFVPGNHEFDRGPEFLRRFLDSLHVPAVAANLDASGDSSLAGKILPCIVVVRSGHRVGIVGVAQPETPGISRPGPRVRFSRASAVRARVDSLRRAGVETILLLSHAGIEEDTVLARTVPGIAAVVGGHSHTRMGRNLTDAGLRTEVPYPVEIHTADGRTVPVVQAWEWGKEVGEIVLHLDDSGRTLGWTASPFLPLSDTISRDDSILPPDEARAVRERLVATVAVRFFPPDAATAAMLWRLERPIDSLRHAVVAFLPREIHRGDPLLGTLCAGALREAGASWGAQVGLQNAGGIRDDLPAGSVTAEAVRKVMPFENTVVVVAITGAQLAALHRQTRGRGDRQPGWDGLTVREDGSLQVRGMPGTLRDADSVRIATNSYLAGGGDGCRILEDVDGFRLNTGISDAEAFSSLLGKAYPTKPVHDTMETTRGTR